MLSQPSETRWSLAFVVMLLLPVFGCQPHAEVDGVPTQDDLLGRLRAEGEVPVMVALVEPAGYGDQGADMDRIRAEIADMQSEVLSSLDSADYRSGTLFASIPAMAGILLSERGLQRLRASPHVEGVDIDSGGTGTR